MASQIKMLYEEKEEADNKYIKEYTYVMDSDDDEHHKDE